VALRDYSITPCAGCLACSCPPHDCVLERHDGSPDRAEEIFSLLRNASALFIAAPIYFYALPAHFKALIDRSQRFWAAQESDVLSQGYEASAIPVIPALTAGRKRGRRLFTGAVLTLTYFTRAFGAALEKPLLLRGLDAPEEFLRRRAVCVAIENLGRHWGKALMLGTTPESPRPCPDALHTLLHARKRS
jgi:hypothetical protein